MQQSLGRGIARVEGGRLPQRSDRPVQVPALALEVGEGEQGDLHRRPAAYQLTADPDVQSTLALALAKLGRTGQAMQVLANVREVDPTNAMVLVNPGTVALMGGKPEKAREAFLAALARNPSLARAHWLAVLAAGAGRFDEATEHWKQTVSLDPREHDKLLALAALLRQRGRLDARVYLRLFADSAPPGAYAADLARALLAEGVPP